VRGTHERLRQWARLRGRMMLVLLLLMEVVVELVVVVRTMVEAR